MHGAQLLYNLILAEEYESAGYDRINEPAGAFRERLNRWSETLPALVDIDTWDFDALLARVDLARGTPVNINSRRFVRGWLDLVREAPANIADDDAARVFMIRRERQHKGAQARIGNRARIATWGGSSGSGALVYRWPQVRGILLDIHDGLDRTSESLNA